VARGQVTIEDPQATLPALILQWYDDGGTAMQRGEIHRRKFDRLNLLGAAVITGPAHDSVFVWACTFVMPEGDLMLLERYARLQYTRQYLFFSDHIEPIPSDQIIGDRTLIPSSTISLPLSFSTANPQSAGFAKFRAWLTLPENAVTDIQYSSNTDQRWKAVPFTVNELPSVVL
jgi:hypothetical protein